MTTGLFNMKNIRDSDNEAEAAAAVNHKTCFTGEAGANLVPILDGASQTEYGET